jgi:hypothetical protein
VVNDFTLDEARTEMLRLSRLIDAGIDYSKQHAVELASAENAYRLGKARGWLECPTDAEGERKWTAARREAWVDGECADLRQARDLAEAMRDAAREAVRARQAQLSAWQTLVRAHQAEAELAKQGA